MRSFCCSSLGSLMFFPKEIFLLFFFSLADVFNSKMISLGKNISEPKEEQQNELFGETHQRAYCASSGSLMCFPKEFILLFFFRLADVFPQREHFAVLL
jgi:hypothetical protein